MTRFFLRMLACIAWLGAAWALAEAATNYRDVVRYTLGGVGIGLVWLGGCCWFGCARPVVDDAEAMKRAALDAEADRDADYPEC